MTIETSMWDTAAEGVTTEKSAHLVSLATAAVEPLWPFIEGATSRVDLDSRLAMSETAIQQALVEVGGALTKGAVHASFTQRWEAAQDRINAAAAVRAAETLRTAQIKAQAATEPVWLAAARRIVENKSFEVIHPGTGQPAKHQWKGDNISSAEGMVLDMYSASALVQVYDGLNEANKAKLAAMSLEQAVDMVFKIINRQSQVQGSKRVAAENRHSTTCPKCKATLSSVTILGDTLTGRCGKCGWSGTKKKKTSAKTAAPLPWVRYYDQDSMEAPSAAEWAQDNMGRYVRLNFEDGDQEWGRFVDVMGQPEWHNDRNDYTHPMDWAQITSITPVAERDSGQEGLFDKAPFDLTAAKTAADDGQKCPSCGQYEAHWESTGDTDEDGEPEKALYCSNCDYGVDKVEKHSTQHMAGPKSYSEYVKWCKEVGFTPMSKSNWQDARGLLDSAERKKTSAKHECEHAGDHHSEDVQAVYHGSTTPTYVCGYHASQIDDYSNFPKKTSSLTKKTAGIAWSNSTHMGVGFLQGKAPNGDIYEAYFNPNMNPTPCAWVNYGPEGDNGPNSGIAQGRGFATMEDAVADAERHAGATTAVLRAFAAAPWTPAGGNDSDPNWFMQNEFGSLGTHTVDGVTVHTFASSGQAYNESQVSDSISDGDVLYVPSENLAGILNEAWPVVVAGGPGEFHSLKPPYTIESIEGGKYARAAEVARKVLSSHTASRKTAEGVTTCHRCKGFIHRKSDGGWEHDGGPGAGHDASPGQDYSVKANLQRIADSYKDTGETFDSTCDNCGKGVVFKWLEAPGGFRTSEPAKDDGSGSDYLGTWCADCKPARRGASKQAASDGKYWIYRVDHTGRGIPEHEEPFTHWETANNAMRMYKQDDRDNPIAPHLNPRAVYYLVGEDESGQRTAYPKPPEGKTSSQPHLDFGPQGYSGEPDKGNAYYVVNGSTAVAGPFNSITAAEGSIEELPRLEDASTYDVKFIERGEAEHFTFKTSAKTSSEEAAARSMSDEALERACLSIMEVPKHAQDSDDAAILAEFDRRFTSKQSFRLDDYGNSRYAPSGKHAPKETYEPGERVNLHLDHNAPGYGLGSEQHQNDVEEDYDRRRNRMKAGSAIAELLESEAAFFKRPRSDMQHPHPDEDYMAQERRLRDRDHAEQAGEQSMGDKRRRYYEDHPDEPRSTAASLGPATAALFAQAGEDEHDHLDPEFHRHMYEWGYSHGERVRTGESENSPWTNADGSKIDWEHSDKPFPTGFRDGLAGRPMSFTGSRTAADTKGHEYKKSSWGTTCIHCGMDKPEPGEWVPECSTVTEGFGDPPRTAMQALLRSEAKDDYLADDEDEAGYTCPRCKGSGNDPGSTDRCTECDGNGVLPYGQPMTSSRRQAVNESGYGAERYQSLPNPPKPGWISEWADEDAKATKKMTEEGMNAFVKPHPFAERLVTVRRAAMKMAGFGEEETTDPVPTEFASGDANAATGETIPDVAPGIEEQVQVNKATTTKPRVIPSQSSPQQGLDMATQTEVAPGQMGGGGGFDMGYSDTMAPDSIGGGDPSMPTVDQLVAAKVNTVAARIRVDNPTMSSEDSRRLAARTVAEYPEMIRFPEKG